MNLALRSFPLQTEADGPAPDDTFGPFRVLHQIGAGVLGPVFRAYDPESDRLVAVKLFRLDLPPERVHRLVAAFERVIAASLTHPALSAPIAAGIFQAQPFLVQEYVAAESLDVVIRDSGPLPVADALRVAAQLAGALDFAAVANITHGALHPRDVLLSAEDTRLTGIGIAHALEQIGAAVPVRRPYTAPERIGGAGWNRRADVFSLAALMYEMLWGRRVAGTGLKAAESVSELPEADLHALRTVFARALDENPAERFETALEFAEALKNAFRDVAIGSSPIVAAEPLLPLDPPPLDLNLRADRDRFQEIEPPALPAATSVESSEPPIPAGLVETRPVPVQPSDSESSRSAIWPLALALVVGLALGFAGGYGVGSHDRSAPVVSTPPAQALAESRTVRTPASAPPIEPPRLVIPAKSGTTGATATNAPPTPKNRAATQVARAGQLLVRSTPAGAQVFVDSRASGRTPTTVGELTRGAHRIRVTRDGYTAVERRVVITQSRPSQTVTLRLPPARVAANLTPAAVPAPPAPAAADRLLGSLNVDSRPVGARVFVDGRLVGTTPMQLSDVSASHHAIRLELDGYRRWSSSVRIVSNEQNRVTASLEK